MHTKRKKLPFSLHTSEEERASMRHIIREEMKRRESGWRLPVHNEALYATYGEEAREMKKSDNEL